MKVDSAHEPLLTTRPGTGGVGRPVGDHSHMEIPGQDERPGNASDDRGFRALRKRTRHSDTTHVPRMA